MKKALVIGINNYPGTQNDLSGCINDGNDWLSLFNDLNFDYIISFFDEFATKATIKNNLRYLIESSSYGDVIVMTYSGHGTSVIDTSGDEEDGYDEALYVYDGILLDDELREIIKDLPEGVVLVIILDSCFSGTATKATTKNKIRYVETDKRTRNLPRKRSFLKSGDMREILIAGCSDSEYSYDAYIDGRYNGAFTYYALKSFRLFDTYNQWIESIRDYLPSSQYPQTPQLEGNNLNQFVFEPIFKPPTTVDEITIDPVETVIKISWFRKIWNWIINLFK